MAQENLLEGETYTRITFLVEGEVYVREYKDCYAFLDPKTGHVFVRAYSDPGDAPPRAVFPFTLTPILENHGEYKAPVPSRKPAQAHQQPAAPPTALPTERRQKEAMERFLEAAPPAESHLPERKFLESDVAAPKDESATGETSTSDPNTEETSSGKFMTHLPPETGSAEFSSEGLTGKKAGNHKRPKPLKRSGTGGPALSALMLPFLSLAFRHRTG